MKIYYSSGKPRECKYCYYWNRNKKQCIKETCYYISSKKDTITMCNGCPYGRVYPCIGWCTLKILSK